VGFEHGSGFSCGRIEATVEERQVLSFASVGDFYHRTLVDSRSLSNLIRAVFLALRASADRVALAPNAPLS
jgi:ribosomal protein S5